MFGRQRCLLDDLSIFQVIAYLEFDKVPSLIIVLAADEDNLVIFFLLKDFVDLRIPEGLISLYSLVLHRKRNLFLEGSRVNLKFLFVIVLYGSDDKYTLVIEWNREEVLTQIYAEIILLLDGLPTEIIALIFAPESAAINDSMFDSKRVEEIAMETVVCLFI